MKDRVLVDIGAKELEDNWHAFDWQSVNRRVKNLRRRIFRATQNGRLNKVRSLMKLMLRSYANLLQSVRKITQDNQGRRTPGIDNQVILNPRGRMCLVHSMSKHQTWKVKPAKRVYIPKSDGKQRPLGILTIKNRVAQAIVKNALEPNWEARFEQHSYGFRPGRSTHDAIEQCFRRLNRQCGDIWVLDADIKSAFDNISHNFILERLGPIPGRHLIKEWLKAGYVEAEIFNATTSGVPQGGVISPLLANVAMDGMETLVKGKLGFIRYADDFVVTAKSKEQLEAIKPVIERFLNKRGLSLNKEKTRIVSIHDGFDFLGFNLRRYNNKCLIKPQKAKTLSFLKGIRSWLTTNWQIETENVIAYLNPRLNGWGNYYRHAVSKAIFSYVDNQVWRALWRWCLHRHPNKSRYWIANKYFGVDRNKCWRFHAFLKTLKGVKRKIELRHIQEIPITRHIKVKGQASTDDPTLLSYWSLRECRLSERKAKTVARTRVIEA